MAVGSKQAFQRAQVSFPQKATIYNPALTTAVTPCLASRLRSLVLELRSDRVRH
jgi:hypothetical protein